MSSSLITKVALTLVAVPLFFGSVSIAENLNSDGKCEVGQKLSQLVKSWKGVAKEAQALDSRQKKNILAKVNEVKKDCPVGKRLGTTLQVVNETLGMVIALDKENAKHCPLESKNFKPQSEDCLKACNEAKEMKKARAGLLSNLQQLTTYTSGFASGKCCSEKTPSSQVQINADGKTCSTEKSACPIKMASRIGEIKASWKVAQKEAKAISSEKKQELLASFQTLAKSNKAVALMPSSLQSVGQGFAALEKIQQKMMVFSQKNPEIMKNVPKEAFFNFMIQSALLNEVKEVLGSVEATMGIMKEGSVKALSKS